MTRKLVRLEPGKPEIIALKFTWGTAYEHRVMFTTTDNRILYLANGDASRLAQLGIAKEAQFYITLVGMSGRQPRYEFRSLSEAIAAAAEPVPNCACIDTIDSPAPPIDWPENEGLRADPVPATTAPRPTQSLRMMSCFMSAIDVVAEAQIYARRKGLAITFSNENVTSTALSCYINECKAGRA